MTTGRRIALFLPGLAGGGAERVMVNLARGFAARGVGVDLVLVQASGPYLSEVPSPVRIVDLQAAKTSTSIPKLVRYLRRERPPALLSTLNNANLAAVVAQRAAGVATRTVLRQADTFSVNARAAVGAAKITVRLVRRAFHWADRVVAVSEAVAQDLARATNVPCHRIDVIPNPVVTSDLATLAQASATHPWFANGGPPVILGVGRLTPQKDFATLLHAFARVRQQRPARLVILGEGAERGALEALVDKLGLTDCASLPGFVQNPFAFMARAAVFVLSSAWEGLPGALIQALACGAPVVATDCESGPRDILRGGRFGRLVPVGDVPAMADAILGTLAHPPRAVSSEAWHPYAEEAAVTGYLRVLLAGANE